MASPYLMENHLSRNSRQFYDHIKMPDHKIAKSHLLDLSTPNTTQRFTRKDILPVVTEIFCLIVGLFTVFWPGAAIWLGQVYQLVVVGFVLSVAALATEAIVLRTVLVSAGTTRHVRLEDLDSILRKDILASRVRVYYRILLLCLMSTPIGLSVAYKTFIGGHTTQTFHSGSDGIFGCATTPGNQRIGDGLSLLSQVYLPFWVDPAINRTYGYNLFVVNNSTAAVLDTPRPEYLSLLQATLHNGQSLQLTATVNATISQLVVLSNDQRSNTTYWDDLEATFGVQPSVNGGGIFGQGNTLWTSSGNGSLVVSSAWNTTKNETMMSEAVVTQQSRGLANGLWTITSENITLEFASVELDSIASCDQTLIQENQLSIQGLFGVFIGEYDWHNRAGTFDYPYPTPQNILGDRWYQPVNTVPPLIASIYWARITSLDTIDRPQGAQDGYLRTLSAYAKPSEEIRIIKSVPSLRRSWWLLLTLLVNPILCVISILVKALLSRHSTVSEDLNSITLAKYVDNDSLVMSQGDVR